MHNSRMTKTLVFLETQDLKTQDFHRNTRPFNSSPSALVHGPVEEDKEFGRIKHKPGKKWIEAEKWILDRSLLNFVLKIDIL